MKYFLKKIEHLVCHIMCHKNFENQLTNIKVLGQSIFVIGISCKKNHAREIITFQKQVAQGQRSLT